MNSNLSGAITPKRNIPAYKKGKAGDQSATDGETKTILRQSKKRSGEGAIVDELAVTPDNHENKLKQQFNMVSWNDFENLQTDK